MGSDVTQNSQRYTIEVEPEQLHDNPRIDQYVTDRIGAFTRSQIASDQTQISVNGVPAKKSRKVRPGDVIEVVITHEELQLEPEPIDLDILYENARVVVVNKPQGMVVHPAAGNWHGTLVQALMYHCDITSSRQTIRPGIVHRLDKDTSGTIIVAKDVHAHELLAKQFSNRKVKKTYIAITKGNIFPSKGTITGRIVRDSHHRKTFTVTQAEDLGKAAQTHYRVLRHYQGYDLVQFMPKTGRTHQIRVHARSIGHPVLGDPVYSRPDSAFRQASLMLHAFELGILIPGELPEQEKLTPKSFRSPLPERFKHILRACTIFDGVYNQ
ncbi:MAG: RluA family pseudouridine synthase [Spirochaetota bacterium]